LEAALSPDVAAGMPFVRAHARLEEARVEDARAVADAATDKAPFFVRPLLGDGPLVMSAAADVGPEVATLRVHHARLGQAELHGAARTSPRGLVGAAAGRLGPVPIGVHLERGDVDVKPFVSEGWLDAELAASELAPFGTLSAR